MDEERVVRTAVRLSEGDDLYNLGSGYLISDGLVLTAAHVLERTRGLAAQIGEPVELAGVDGSWQRGTVAWIDAVRDIAVASCPALHTQGEVGWGRLTGSVPLEWGAVGFPRASMDLEGLRQPEHAYGTVSPISERQAERLALTLDSRVPVGGDSTWAGLSGAAVFSSGFLVGVITTAPVRYSRSLVGRRTECFYANAGLAQLLGGPPKLTDVGGERFRVPQSSALVKYLKAARAAAQIQPYAISLPGAPQLSSVYVPQRLSLHPQSIRYGTLTLATEQMLQPLHSDSEIEDRLALVGVSRLFEKLDPLEAVRQNRSTLITGQPGTGKSSLLRHIVETTADTWLGGGSESFIPVLVHADSFIGDLPLPEALAEGVSRHLGALLDDSGSLTFFGSQPVPGVPWLVMIDGIDEIASSAARISKVLNTVAHWSDDSRYKFLLASRIPPQEELRRIRESGIQILEIQVLSEEEIVQLARRCFEALDAREPDELTYRFTTHLSRPGLADLARNPLITTAICVALADNPKIELPPSRADLYERLVEVLLRKPFTQFNALERLQETIRSYGNGPQRAIEKVVADLRPLTQFLAANQLSQTDDRTLLDYAAEFPSSRNPPEVDKSVWRDLLSEVLSLSGCLFKQGKDFHFIHKTVMEYLAACNIIRAPHLTRRQKLDLAIRAGEGDSYALFAVTKMRERNVDITRKTPLFLSIRRLIHARLIASMFYEGITLDEKVLELASRRLTKAAMKPHKSLLDRLYESTWWRGEDGRVLAARSLKLLDGEKGDDALAWVAAQPGVEDFNIYNLLADNAIRNPATKIDQSRGVDALVALARNPAQDGGDRILAVELVLELDQARGIEITEHLAQDQTLVSIDRMKCASLLLESARERGVQSLVDFASDRNADLRLRFVALRRLRYMDPDISQMALEKIAFNSSDTGLARQVASIQLYKERPPEGRQAIAALASDTSIDDSSRLNSYIFLNREDSEEHLEQLSGDLTLSARWRLVAAKLLAIDNLDKGVAAMRDINRAPGTHWRVRLSTTVSIWSYRLFHYIRRV